MRGESDVCSLYTLYIMVLAIGIVLWFVIRKLQ